MNYLPLILTTTLLYLMCAFVQFGYRFSTHGDALWVAAGRAVTWPRGLVRWLGHSASSINTNH